MTECLIALCRLFAEHRQRSLSTISRLATGSGETVSRLERGCAITTRRAARAIQWFSDHWPEDLDWPTDTPRPKPSGDLDAREAA